MKDKQAERIKVNEDIAAGTRIVFCKVNLIGRAEMIFGREGWKHNETWMTKYPVIPKIFADFMDPDCNPWCQSHSAVRRNYSDRPSYRTFHIHGRNKLDSFEAQKKMLPGSMVFELPVQLDAKAMFVNADEMDFRQKPGFKPVEGFVEIPFERIGLHLDEYRKAMPDEAAYRIAIKKRYETTPSFGGRFDYDKLNERYASPAYLTSVTP